MEDVKVLQISTEKSVANVRELRDYIKELKDALNEEGKTLEENAKDAEDLRAAQAALRDAMYATTKSADDLRSVTDSMIDENGKLVTSTAGLTVSYNDLVHQLADLKSAWRSTTSEAERHDLGDQIDKINSKLKELDASTGTYSRNVGNYTNHITTWMGKMTSGFAATAGGAKSVIQPLTSVTAGLKAMSATPVIAILGLLANAISTVTRELKSSEENTLAMNRALAAFQPIADAMKRTIQGLGESLATLSNWIVDLLDKWGLLSDASKERMALAEQEGELSQQVRDNIVSEARLARDAANLRADAADKEKYSTETRIKFLKEAQMSEQAIYDNRAAIEYEIEKQKSTYSANSAAEQKRLAELEAAVIRTEAEAAQKRRQYTKEITSLRKQDASEARQAAQAAKQAAKEKVAATQAELTAEKDLLKQEAELLAAGSEERLQKEIQARELEYQIAVASAKEKVKNADNLARTLTALEAKYLNDIEKLERDHARAVSAEEVRVLQNRVSAAEQGSADYLVSVVALKRKELQSIERLEGETDAALAARRIAAAKALSDALLAVEEAGIKSRATVIVNATAALYDGELNQLQAVAALRRARLNGMYKEEGESEEAFRERLLQARRDYEDAVDALETATAERRTRAAADRVKTEQEKRLEQELAVRRQALDTIHKMEGENEDEFQARMLAARRDYDDAVERLARETAARRIAQETEYYTAEERQLASSVAAKRKALEDIHKAEEESDDAFYARRLQAWEEYDKALADLAAAAASRSTSSPTGGADIAAIQKEVADRKAALDALHQMEGENEAAFYDRQLEARQQYETALTALITEAGTVRDAEEETRIRSGAEARLALEVELKRRELENLHREEGESEEAFYARMLEARGAYHDALAALAEEQLDQERLVWENRMNAHQQGSDAYLTAAVALKRFELDTLHQMEEESDEEFRARQLAAEKEYQDAMQALWQGRIGLMQSYVSAVSSILGSLADIYEQDSENNEKAAKQAKNLRIATAVIDTISGAVTAYMTAQKLGPPQGLIVGALNAAAVTAAGVAQIAKIKATQVSRNGDGSGGETLSVPTSTAPEIPETPQQTALVDTAYNTQQLNANTRDQRVYILQSDLEESGKQVQVRQTETSF